MSRRMKKKRRKGGENTKSLEMMVTEDKGRLAVMEKGKIIGLITRNGVARYIQIRKEIS